MVAAAASHRADTLLAVGCGSVLDAAKMAGTLLNRLGEEEITRLTVEDVERLLVSGSGGSGWGTGAGVGVGALGGPKSTRAVACVTVPTLPCAGAELSRVAALRCFAPGAAEKRYVAVDAPLVALVQPGLAHRAPMELLHDRCALVGPPGNAVCSHVGTHFQAHQCPPPPQGAPCLARLEMRLSRGGSLTSRHAHPSQGRLAGRGGRRRGSVRPRFPAGNARVGRPETAHAPAGPRRAGAPLARLEVLLVG